MILYCGCMSGPGGVKTAVEYQDVVYGIGNRVHTPMAKHDPPYFRCTVCGIERSGESAKAKQAREEREKAEKEKSGQKLSKTKS